MRKKPAWRLRYRARDTDTHAVGELLDDLVAHGRIVAWAPAVYEPETVAFGGATAMDVAHASSTTTATTCSPTPRRRAAGPARDHVCCAARCCAPPAWTGTSRATSGRRSPSFAPATHPTACHQQRPGRHPRRGDAAAHDRRHPRTCATPRPVGRTPRVGHRVREGRTDASPPRPARAPRPRSAGGPRPPRHLPRQPRRPVPRRTRPPSLSSPSTPSSAHPSRRIHTAAHAHNR